MRPFAIGCRLVAPRVMTLGLLAGSAVAASPPAAIPAAQGAVQGQVQGQAQNGVAQPLAGASVALDGHDGQAWHQQVQTDGQGQFALRALPPGRYTITAQAASLTPQSFDLIVLPGRTVDVSFQLIVDPAAVYRERMAKEYERQQIVADGLRRAAANDYMGAAAQFRQSIVLAPDCAVCFFHLGQAEAGLKQEEAAERAYKQAISLNPEYVEAYGALAGLYNERRAFAQAIENGTRAADLADRLAPDRASLYRYDEGVYLWNAGRVPEARQAFEAALRLDPGNADAHFELALALINQGDVPSAADHLRTYLHLAPQGADAARARTLLARLSQ